MTKILEAKNIVHKYDEKEVLKNISIEVEEKEFLGVIGPNGSGKTTLLKVLSRGIKQTSGEILFKGKNILTLRTKYLATNIAIVPQEEAIIFPFTVFEIVMMGRAPYIRRFSWETRSDIDIAEKSMKLADVLHLKNRLINELSSGERQRAIIARGLAQKPKVLLLDEPTSHLDINHQIEIFNLLKRLNEEELITIVVVSHDINLASKYCRRLILLKNGKIFKQGNVNKVVTKQNIKNVYSIDIKLIKNPETNTPNILL